MSSCEGSQVKSFLCVLYSGLSSAEAIENAERIIPILSEYPQVDQAIQSSDNLNLETRTGEVSQIFLNYDVPNKIQQPLTHPNQNVEQKSQFQQSDFASPSENLLKGLEIVEKKFAQEDGIIKDELTLESVNNEILYLKKLNELIIPQLTEFENQKNLFQTFLQDMEKNEICQKIETQTAEIKALKQNQDEQNRELKELTAQSIQIQKNAFQLNLIQSQIEEHFKRIKQMDAENVRVNKIITKQSEQFVTITQYESKINVLKSSLAAHVLEKTIASFVSKEEFQLDCELLQGQLTKIKNQFETQIAILPKLVSNVTYLSDNIEQKSKKTDFQQLFDQVQTLPTKQELDDRVKDLPVRKDIVEMKEYLMSRISSFQQKIDSSYQSINKFQFLIDNQTKIIGRYDEVICQKASKHSFEQLKNDCLKEIQDFRHDHQITQQTITQLKYSIDYLTVNQQQIQNDLMTQQKFLQSLRSVPQELQTAQQNVKQLQSNTKMKLNIDQFELRINQKTDETEQQYQDISDQFHFIQNNLQTLVVLLQESLNLHQLRADETYQSKQNKLNHIFAQVQLLVNNLSFKGDFQQLHQQSTLQQSQISKNNSKAMPSQIHNALPLSPRPRRSTMLRMFQKRNQNKILQSSDDGTHILCCSTQNMPKIDQEALETCSEMRKSFNKKLSLTQEIFRKKTALIESSSSETLKAVPFVISNPVNVTKKIKFSTATKNKLI